jgi:hypothetical protein
LRHPVRNDRCSADRRPRRENEQRSKRCHQFPFLVRLTNDRMPVLTPAAKPATF